MRAKERLEHLSRGGCRTNLFALLKSNNSLNTTVNGDVQRSEPKKQVKASGDGNRANSRV